MSKQEWPRLASYAALAAVVSMSTGCHTLKAQLAALKGQPADTASSSSKGTSQPKVLQFWGGSSTPLLERNYRPAHEQAASGGPLRLSTPHFEWTDHGGAGGSTFQDPEPSSARPPRSFNTHHSKS
jgi:hypothetical protein